MPLARVETELVATEPARAHEAIDGSILLPVALGVIAIFVAWKRGYLRRDSLAAAPPRLASLAARELCVAVCLLSLGVLFAGVVVAQFGLAVTEAQAPDKPWLFVARLYVGQLCAQAPAVLYLLARASGESNGLRAIGLAPGPGPRDLFAACAATLLAMPIVLGVIGLTVALAGLLLNVAPPPRGHELLGIVARTHDHAAVAAMLGSAIVLAPLLEELLFRGLIQTATINVLGREHRWPALFLVAGLFTLMHVSVLHPLTLPGMFLLSIVFGWLYERTGRLWPGVLLHVAFNAINTLMSFALDA